MKANKFVIEFDIEIYAIKCKIIDFNVDKKYKRGNIRNIL